MSEEKVYRVTNTAASQSHLNAESFQKLYKQSINSPDEFWASQAEELLYWHEPWQSISSGSFEKAEPTWFAGAKLNVAYNCIDRHLEQRGDQTAIIWEGDDPQEDKKITYRELHSDVCKFSNALKARGVKKGDRVCIYMPMIPEAAYAMLACARIGAVHSVVFGGFSPESIKDRILDSDCQTVITADEGLRGGRTIPLKANVDSALEYCPNVHSVFVIRRTEAEVSWLDHRDVWYHEATATASSECDVELMDAEDPLFILYTSGSTGKPKGVLHTTAGYLLGASITHKYVFDYHDGDIYWCTADVGWVTGHSYIVYGPLANGAITLMFEGFLHFRMLVDFGKSAINTK
jgi:acetyl-CoA synthetase